MNERIAELRLRTKGFIEDKVNPMIGLVDAAAGFIKQRRREIGAVATAGAILLAPVVERMVSAAGLIDNPTPQIGSERVLNQVFGMKTITLPSEDGVPMQFQVPSNFEPDPELRGSSDLSFVGVQPGDYDKFRRFQQGLNEPLDGFGPLAGYSYGKNDIYTDLDPDFMGHTQYPAYAWTVVTGLEARIPGIGSMRGGDHVAVMFQLLNRDKTVYKVPTYIESGFLGTGRLWDAHQPPLLNEASRRLAAHFGASMLFGEVTSGFTGQCDDGDINCNAITEVRAARQQWGNNPDGSPRHVITLIGGSILR